MAEDMDLVVLAPCRRRRGPLTCIAHWPTNLAGRTLADYSDMTNHDMHNSQTVR